jgi:hypothetical protein
MENEKEFSPEESLHLIRTMIGNTRNSFADNSFYFLFWGWLVFSCCVAQYILKVWVGVSWHYYVWMLTIAGGIISGIYGSRQSKSETVKTFVDEALDYLWISLGLSFIVLIAVNIFRPGAWATAFTYYILLYAIGTFVTGRLIHFRPLVVGSLFNFILAIATIFADYDSQLLLGALALLTSYIIPGHMLRIRHQKSRKAL